MRKVETVTKECPNCSTIYSSPATAGCTICPGCGQRSCGE
jgi:hypothetical protein